MRIEKAITYVSAVGFVSASALAASLAFTSGPSKAPVPAPTASRAASEAPVTPEPVVAELRADEILYADSLRGSYPILAGVPAVELRNRGRTLCAHLLENDYVKGSGAEAGWTNLGMIGSDTRSDMGLQGVDDWFAAFDLTAKYLCPDIASVG